MPHLQITERPYNGVVLVPHLGHVVEAILGVFSMMSRNPLIRLGQTIGGMLVVFFGFFTAFYVVVQVFMSILGVN